MKTEELKALGIDDDKIAEIFKLHGKSIQSKEKENESLKTEVETYKTQMSETQIKIKEFEGMDIEGIKKASEDLKSKYELDTNEMKSKLDKQAYEFKAKEYLNTHKFANDLSKKAVYNEFMSKNFTEDGESFLGVDDFMNKLKESQPTAFILEDKQDDKPPSFGTSTTKNTNTNQTPEQEKASILSIMGVSPTK